MVNRTKPGNCLVLFVINNKAQNQETSELHSMFLNSRLIIYGTNNL